MTDSEEFFNSNWGNLYAINPRLAKNYEKLNEKIKAGFFNIEKFGPEELVKKYADSFAKIEEAISNNKFTNVTKAELNQLNKALKFTESKLQGRIEQFTKIANDVNKAIGVDITTDSIKNAKYSMRSPEYLGLKNNVKSVNAYAALYEAEQKLTAQQKAVKASNQQLRGMRAMGMLFGQQMLADLGGQFIDSFYYGAEAALKNAMYEGDYESALKNKRSLQNKSLIKNMFGSVTTGAIVGSQFGPIGTGVGLAVGTLHGLATTGTENVKYNDDVVQKYWQTIHANRYTIQDLQTQRQTEAQSMLIRDYSRSKDSNIGSIAENLTRADKSLTQYDQKLDDLASQLEKLAKTKYKVKSFSNLDYWTDAIGLNDRATRQENFNAYQLTQLNKVIDEYKQTKKLRDVEFGRRNSLEQASYDYQAYKLQERMYNDDKSFVQLNDSYARNKQIAMQFSRQFDIQAGMFTNPQSLAKVQAYSKEKVDKLIDQELTIRSELDDLNGIGPFSTKKTDELSKTRIKYLENKLRQVQQERYKEEETQLSIQDQLNQQEMNKFNLNKALSKSAFKGQISNTLSNPFVQVDEIDKLFKETLNKQTAIGKQISDITGTDELSLTKKANLVNDFNEMAQLANTLKSARDSQYNQILASAANSKYLTSNLGSFGRWSGTNDAGAVMTRLTSQQNQLLQRILDALLSEDRGMYYQ